uniref:PABC domain-containing protein n=1 Tax=Arcella intermedia TaxID=1963864 RepID=A0A6B2LUU2_9EUKA
MIYAGAVPFTKEALLKVPPVERRQMIGEVLYPMVQQINPELAGKITGMILEVDLELLLEVVYNKERRDQMVAEALQVLRDFLSKK